MAYTSFEELIDDASRDPKLAKLRVARAKESGIPVVAKNNSGYRAKAIANRLGAQKPGVKQEKGSNPVKYSTAIQKRLKTSSREVTPPEDDDEDQVAKIAAKRKRVGY